MRPLVHFLATLVATSLFVAPASAQLTDSTPGIDIFMADSIAGNGNTGFGGPVGGGTLYIDSAVDGTLTFGMTRGAGGNMNDTLVIYIDSVAGGVDSTLTLMDAADGSRRAISGVGTALETSDLSFSSGFTADYAIAFQPGAGAYLFDLSTPASLTYVSTWQASGVSTSADASFTFSGNISDLGIAAGDTFAFVATYLNNGNAFRSDEGFAFSVSGGNIGTSPTTLPADSFESFSSVPGNTCGNSMVEGLEVCDDGNTMDGDGCAADCYSTESGYDCPGLGGACSDIDECGGVFGSLIITGIIDGPLGGGTPKAVELQALSDIADLSVFGLGSANNGGGTDGEEFTFPADSVTAGTTIYVASEATEFTSFFGFAPDYTSSAVGVNGDDAVELFEAGVVIDTFGDPDVDGTAQVWEYTDGWAYRISTEGPLGGFDPMQWTFSGVDALDTATDNASAMTPFPAGTWRPTPCDANASCNNLSGSFECMCNAGFMGDGFTCLNVDDCSPNPCQNGGTCIDGVDAFTCNCPMGFFGADCSGVCMPSDCDDGNSCTADACDPVMGCTHTPVMVGTSCDDGLFCTVMDACDAMGACVGSARDCGDGVGCTTDSCDDSTDMCVNLTDDAACDDGNGCTTNTCSATLDCQTVADTGEACDDGDACTSGDSCDTMGVCAAGGATDCDDMDMCTADSCDAVTGCAHDAISCDDMDACTADSCDAATGCANVAISCDDMDACTADSCDAATGCANVAISCDDMDACTADSCDAATGCANVAISCDDLDPCTADACDSATGCTHTPIMGCMADAGTPMDAGVDAGTPMDAGVDAGTPTDAGLDAGIDAAVPVDGGVDLDASVALDGAMAMDGGDDAGVDDAGMVEMDGGVAEMDANVSLDGGTAEDAGETPLPSDEAGCDCSARSESGRANLVWLLGLFFVLGRRRRG